MMTSQQRQQQQQQQQQALCLACDTSASLQEQLPLAEISKAALKSEETLMWLTVHGDDDEDEDEQEHHQQQENDRRRGGGGGGEQEEYEAEYHSNEKKKRKLKREEKCRQLYEDTFIGRCAHPFNFSSGWELRKNQQQEEHQQKEENNDEDEEQEENPEYFGFRVFLSSSKNKTFSPFFSVKCEKDVELTISSISVNLLPQQRSEHHNLPPMLVSIRSASSPSSISSSIGVVTPSSQPSIRNLQVKCLRGTTSIFEFNLLPSRSSSKNNNNQNNNNNNNNIAMTEKFFVRFSGHARFRVSPWERNQLRVPVGLPNFAICPQFSSQDGTFPPRPKFYQQENQNQRKTSSSFGGAGGDKDELTLPPPATSSSSSSSSSSSTGTNLQQQNSNNNNNNIIALSQRGNPFLSAGGRCYNIEEQVVSILPCLLTDGKNCVLDARGINGERKKERERKVKETQEKEEEEAVAELARRRRMMMMKRKKERRDRQEEQQEREEQEEEEEEENDEFIREERRERKTKGKATRTSTRRKDPVHDENLLWVGPPIACLSSSTSEMIQSFASGSMMTGQKNIQQQEERQELEDSSEKKKKKEKETDWRFILGLDKEGNNVDDDDDDEEDEQEEENEKRREEKQKQKKQQEKAERDNDEKNKRDITDFRLFSRFYTPASSSRPVYVRQFAHRNSDIIGEVKFGENLEVCNLKFDEKDRDWYVEWKKLGGFSRLHGSLGPFVIQTFEREGFETIIFDPPKFFHPRSSALPNSLSTSSSSLTSNNHNNNNNNCSSAACVVSIRVRSRPCVLDGFSFENNTIAKNETRAAVAIHIRRKYPSSCSSSNNNNNSSSSSSSSSSSASASFPFREWTLPASGVRVRESSETFLEWADAGGGYSRSSFTRDLLLDDDSSSSSSSSSCSISPENEQNTTSILSILQHEERKERNKKDQEEEEDKKEETKESPARNQNQNRNRQQNQNRYDDEVHKFLMEDLVSPSTRRLRNQLRRVEESLGNNNNNNNNNNNQSQNQRKKKTLETAAGGGGKTISNVNKKDLRSDLRRLLLLDFLNFPSSSTPIEQVRQLNNNSIFSLDILPSFEYSFFEELPRFF